jgi:hypothetical protein
LVVPTTALAHFSGAVVGLAETGLALTGGLAYDELSVVDGRLFNKEIVG